MPAGMTKPLATLLSNVGATESGPTASNQAGGFCRGREGGAIIAMSGNISFPGQDRMDNLAKVHS